MFMTEANAAKHTLAGYAPLLGKRAGLAGKAENHEPQGPHQPRNLATEGNNDAT